MALSKLYGRPLVVYNEQEDSVQEQVFPSSEEEEQPTSAEQLQDPVSLLCFFFASLNRLWAKDDALPFRSFHHRHSTWVLMMAKPSLDV